MNNFGIEWLHIATVSFLFLQILVLVMLHGYRVEFYFRCPYVLFICEYSLLLERDCFEVSYRLNTGDRYTGLNWFGEVLFRYMLCFPVAC